MTMNEENWGLGLQYDYGLINDRQPFPGVLPAFSLGNRKMALNLTYIPKVHPKLIPLWFSQLKVAL